MSKIKNGGLDQYGVGLFEQQQFGTAGVEEVNQLLYYAVSVRLSVPVNHGRGRGAQCCRPARHGLKRLKGEAGFPPLAITVLTTCRSWLTIKNIPLNGCLREICDYYAIINRRASVSEPVCSSTCKPRDVIS